MSQTKTIIVLVLAAIIDAIPLPLLKEYTKTGNSLYLIATVILYLILIFTYIYLVKVLDIAIFYPLVNVLSAVIVILFAVIFFKEKLTIKHVIGISLSIVAVYLLS